MKTNIKTLTPELLDRMDAYWRAANDLSVGQIFLTDHPLLKRPLALTDGKHMLLGHRTTTPEHKRYINENGQDMPETRNWKRGGPDMTANSSN